MHTELKLSANEICSIENRFNGLEGNHSLKRRIEALYKLFEVSKPITIL